MFRLVIFFSWALPVLAFAHDGEHVFTMTDAGYEPVDMIVDLGETVIFKNEGLKPRWPASNIHPTHNIFPEFDPQKPIAAGESWSFKFEKPGVWRWHDHLSPKMNGAITVLGETLMEAAEKPSLWKRLVAWLVSFFKKSDPGIEKNSTAIFNDKEALRAYVKKFGPAKTVERLNELSEKFGSCHDAAHEAGRFAYKEFGGKAFQECSAECHSGCYHGATEAYFKENGAENLAQSLQAICGKNLNSFFNHQCVHGIGHGLMAWTDYDLPEALKACEQLPDGQLSCWTGVFMENIVGGLGQSEGHFTEYLNDNPHFPCSVVEEKYKNACYFLQTSRMIQLFQNDFSKVAKACAEAPEAHRRSCYESMGRDAGGVNQKNPAGAITACSNIPPGNARVGCLTGAVQDYFWDPSGQDAALSFCRLLSEPSEKTPCYQTLFERAPSLLNTKKELQSFCGKAEAPYRAKCLEFAK